MRLGLSVHCKASDVSGARAFTLIELMIVLALISVLAGAFSFALRDNAGSALTSAQNTLATMVGQARAQAAVNQTEARLVVHAVRPPSGDATKYLRMMQVFIASPQGSKTWVAVGNAVYLPRGVFLVPSSVSGLLASGVTWPANPAPLSSFGSDGSPGQPAGTAFNGANAVFYIQFSADGTVTPTANPYLKLVLTTGGLSSANIPAFNNAAALRGLIIRPNGAVSYVNAPTDF
jgi:hypothetical protein